MALPLGKIPVDLLKEVIFKNLGVHRDEVALGPAAGIDGAVINVGSKSLVVSMDPITGALERIGWLAVNVNANDVSTFGVEPAFFLSCILLPEKADRKTVEIISSQMDKAAKGLGMAIVGGHCESTPGLVNPIVVGCAMGMAEKGNYVTAAGAKAGDKIMITKTAGIEGTAILASDREEKLRKTVRSSTLKSAKGFFSMISVAKEAAIAFKTGGVHAMHDPTEGGIAGGIHEVADASNLGFRILEDRIPVAEETSEICKAFEIDPLYLIASGSMLIAARKDVADDIEKNLIKSGISASVVGEFLPSSENRIVKRKNGFETELARPTCDHLWVALAKK
ncbi:MAG: AIR synthase family protein [Candidatus Bathyarchaeia archaeon]